MLAIFVSASVALYETILRFIHPQDLTHLWVLAAAGVIGFVGNEIAAQVRLRGGRRLASPALIAAGNHARIDGFVSLGVVALGARIADPVIGLVITLVITLVIIRSLGNPGASSRRPSQASSSSSLTRFLGQQTGSKRSKSSLRKHAQIRRQKAANPHQ